MTSYLGLVEEGGAGEEMLDELARMVSVARPKGRP